MEKRIVKELESKEGEVRVFAFILIILSIIVVFFGTVFIVGSGKLDNLIKNEKISINKSKVANNKIYKISSNNTEIDGLVEVSFDNQDNSVDVNYFIHIIENLPANKKCFENDEKEDDNCRWVDFYNYVVSIDDGNDKNAIGRLYPVFCSSFSNLSESNTLYDSYNSCWQGEKKNKHKYTDKYFIKINASYDTLDNFLSHNVMNIYDAKEYTERTNITKNKMTTSTEIIHKKDAVKSGISVKKYEFNIIES